MQHEELLNNIAAEALHMRELQRNYFAARKAEGTPYPTKNTKAILELSKAAEAKLDKYLAELVAIVEKEVGSV